MDSSCRQPSILTGVENTEEFASEDTRGASYRALKSDAAFLRGAKDSKKEMPVTNTRRGTESSSQVYKVATLFKGSISSLDLNIQKKVSDIVQLLVNI